MYWLILVIPLLVIIVFTVTRFMFHFDTCRRASEKNPGEKLSGCPSWTLVEENEDEDSKDHKEDDS